MAAAGKADSGSKKKAGVVEQPNKEEYETAQQGITKEIEGLHHDLTALNRKIAEKSTGKEEFLRRKNDMKLKLDEYQKIINDYEKERQECYDQVKKDRDADRAKRDQLNDFKKSLKFDSVEKIDAEIQKTEYKMHTESMTLKQEKDCMQQLKELRAMKPQIAKYSQMEAKNTPTGETGVGVKGRIDELKARIEEAKAAKKAQQDEYKKLLEQRHASMVDVPGLWEEREALNKKINQKIRERRDIQDDYKRQEREFNDWRAEQRSIQYEKGKAERLAQAAKWEKEKAERVADEEEQQPHLAETLLLEQTIHFCKSLLPKEAEEATKETKETAFNNPEGYGVIASKKDRSMEGSLTIGKSKKKAPKKKNTEAKDTKIKHTAESLQIFSKVKVSAPTTTADLPEIIKELERQLAEYKVEVAKWESERDERAAKREKEKQAALQKAEEKAKLAEEAKKAALQRVKEAEEARAAAVSDE